MVNILSLIEQTVAKANTYPQGVYIEYNFELPEANGITPDSFFGIKAQLNPSRPKNTTNLIYKLN